MVVEDPGTDDDDAVFCLSRSSLAAAWPKLDWPRRVVMGESARIPEKRAQGRWWVDSVKVWRAVARFKFIWQDMSSIQPRIEGRRGARKSSPNLSLSLNRHHQLRWF